MRSQNYKLFNFLAYSHYVYFANFICINYPVTHLQFLFFFLSYNLSQNV